MPEHTEGRSAGSMQRTKIQLATTYSPGTLFTFEGNLVVCESRPDASYVSVRLPRYVTDQILKAIEEKVTAWYEIAYSTSTHCTPRMCVDDDLLNRDYDALAEPFAKSSFGFVEPEKMGYQPTLLTMVCNTCRLVRAFETLRRFEAKIEELNTEKCPDPNGEGNCDWRQTDIVFVHPNGTYQQPVPWRYDWNRSRSKVTRRDERCTRCGSYETRLDERSSQIGKRFFYCAECGMKRGSQWLQNDRELLDQFKEQSAAHLAEVRMKPVSYRANSVQYPQQDMVIDFGESKHLEVLADITNRRLVDFVGERFDLRSSDPTDDELEIAVKSKLGEEPWIQFHNKKKVIDSFPSHPPEGQENMELAVDALRNEIARTMEQWRAQGVVPSTTELPLDVQENLQTRRTKFATKHDPFRLLVEHEALLDLVVNDQILENGLRSYTPLDRMDEHIGPVDKLERHELDNRHRHIMDAIGIDTIGLVRNFKTIHFSFGYTRVGPTPRINYINDVLVPVRLKLFSKTMIDGDKRKHPIFVLKQDNEAIYVRLKEEDVRTWLENIKPLGGVDDRPIGLQYLELVPKMDNFLDNLPHDLAQPHFALALYSLLHTYAHHVIGAVSEYSGLAAGSLGEYIFPSDLSFMIFRRGMTMDLGNLTAMLRNNAPAFLHYLMNPRNLACGSGSLCLNRGGACPDCLMIPEVNCLAQNKLLSRSILIGRGSPQTYGFQEEIEGFFDAASNPRS